MSRFRLVVAAVVALAGVMVSATPAHAQDPWWHPTPDTPLSLHWMLSDPLDLSNPTAMGLRDFTGNRLPAPQVYDIDGEFNPASTVAALHAQGKKVICYIDAGVFESYRGDASKFPASVIGAKDGNWDGSWWLDIRRLDVLGPIMQARMQVCRDKGFDAVEPDEIDGYSNTTGFPLTYQDQLTYNRAVASWAHALGLSVGLKGDIEQVYDLVGSFDWSLNEQCFRYRECGGLRAFVTARKAVWIAEYQLGSTLWTYACNTSRVEHWNTTRFRSGLPASGGRLPCPAVNTGTWG